MKKIFILIILILISVTGFSQLKPVYTVATDSTALGIALPKKTLVFDYGANVLYRVDTLGNMSSTIKTLGLDRVNSGMSAGDSAIWATLSGFDSTHCWQKIKTDSIESCSPLVLKSNDSIVYNAPKHKFDNTIYSNGITNTGNLISTNGNFYGSNNGWYCGYDTLFEGVLKMAGVGKFKGSFLTGTYRINGFAYIENIDNTFFGFERKINGVKIKGSSVLADTNKISIMREINDKRMATIYSDTAIITEAMDKMIMSADSGGNHFKVYVPTIVNNSLTTTSYINTDSSYYIKGIEFIKANHNLGNQFIGVGSGANNIVDTIVDSINYPPDIYLGSLNTANGYKSLYSNTEGYHNVANGAYSLYSNTTGSGNIANGTESLYSNTTGSGNVANGAKSLHSNTTGSGNIANGAHSLYNNTTGSGNVANGNESLYSNTEGNANVANGAQSLYSNTTGTANVANGYQSLYNNTEGYGNVANGFKSLYSNTTGSDNIANGAQSLYSNTTGSSNIANGAQSLYSNTTGSDNIANGYQSLYSNTTGGGNVANSAYSLRSNTTGNANIANGTESLYSNTTGSDNIANGYQSLYSNTTGYYNVANGARSLYSNTTGSSNIANGAYSLYSNTTGSSNIAIGYNSGQYADTAANGLLWIGEGDYKNAIIYGNMLTDSLRLNANVNVGTNLMVNQSATIGTDLTVHREIINGGLINKDTVISLADDETFNFPTTSVGWAEIQCDSLLIEKTWGNVSWNGDGATNLRSYGAKFVNTDIDGNYACFYNGGSSYAILKNTSGYTQTYSIKYHYHY
jgi:hypothetical protein